MSKPIQPWEATTHSFVSNLAIDSIGIDSFEWKSSSTDQIRQKGGTKQGLAYLNSFISSRHKSYQNSISKPELSRKRAVDCHLTYHGAIFRFAMYGKPQSKPNAMVPHDFN